MVANATIGGESNSSMIGLGMVVSPWSTMQVEELGGLVGWYCNLLGVLNKGVVFVDFFVDLNRLYLPHKAALCTPFFTFINLGESDEIFVDEFFGEWFGVVW